VPDVDVAIFDHWLPPVWPGDLPVIVLNPPGSLGPVRARSLGSAGLPQREIRETSPDHPVLFRVSTSRLALTQSCVLEAAGSLEPLWVAGTEPLLLAGTVQGQRIVVMGFSPRLSERLPMTSSFPILMGNAIYWCAEGRRAEEAAGFGGGRTGELIEPKGKQLGWTQILDGQVVRNVERIDRGVVELRRSGVWEDLAAGQRGAAHLLSLAESDLPARAADQEPAARTGSSVSLGNLTVVLLSVILVILLLESLLFHRAGVY
jgi:hypothetical protein